MSSRGYRKWINKLPLLVDMYQNRNLSLTEISHITGVPASSIGTLLKEKGIRLREKRRRKKSELFR